MAERTYNTFGAKTYTPPLPFGQSVQPAAQAPMAQQAAAQAAQKQQQAVTPLKGAGRLRQAQEQGSVNPLDMLLADYNALLARPEAWQTVGGPNYGLISQLTAQKEELQKRYQTNTADARNLYGTLSSDEATPSTGLVGEIETMWNQLNQMYQTGIQGSQTTSEARQAALSQEQQRQQANREKVAAQLGIAPESIQTGYESDTALNQAMGDVLSAATSWEGLLGARQTSAAETGKRLITATGNTLNQTLLGMKQNLDAQSAQIDAAIQAEKSKSPTRKLTDIGKVLQDIGLESYKDYLQPGEAPKYSENPAIAKKQQGFEYFGKSMDRPADNKWYSDTYNSIVSKINNAKAGTFPGLTQYEKEFMQVFGITGVGLGTVDPGLYGAQ